MLVYFEHLAVPFKIQSKFEQLIWPAWPWAISEDFLRRLIFHPRHRMAASGTSWSQSGTWNHSLCWPHRSSSTSPWWCSWLGHLPSPHPQRGHTCRGRGSWGGRRLPRWWATPPMVRWGSWDPGCSTSHWCHCQLSGETPSLTSGLDRMSGRGKCKIQNSSFRKHVCAALASEVQLQFPGFAV